MEELAAASAGTGEVTLDSLGHAIGARAVTPSEIDEMLALLEGRGRTVVSGAGGGGEDRLKAVVHAARTLASKLGRPATLREIASCAGLEVDEARHALTLLKIMQR